MSFDYLSTYFNSFDPSTERQRLLSTAPTAPRGQEVPRTGATGMKDTMHLLGADQEKKRSPGLGKITRWLFTIWEVTVRNWRGFWSQKCSENSERKRMWTESREGNGIQIERGENLGFVLDNQAVELGITDVENCYHPKAGWLLLNGVT